MCDLFLTLLILCIPSGLAAKSSYVIPVVIVTVLVLAMAALLFGYIARVRRQRNGRMKLTDKHSESLPDPYPQHRTFENPIYQVGNTTILNKMIRHENIKWFSWKSSGLTLSTEVREVVVLYLGQPNN